ncbi:hypothetical protein [uncultured Roseobacter sp.]|uniref:hypothetical protein n=1 Tax=uncultured Roseobacter sp. TaxID=114847 RepID=UPI00261543E0|nr:hypothetical protein [uncultured Roseobacter sp.]
MDKNTRVEDTSSFGPSAKGGLWPSLYLLAVLCAISLIYSGPLWQVYLFSDEMNVLSAKFRERHFSGDIWTSVYHWTKLTGRPLSGVVITNFQHAYALGEQGLQLLRAIALLASLGGAAGTFYVLRLLHIPPLHATLLIVFIWSQPAFALHHVYLLLMPYWIGFYCALLSFVIFYSRRDKRLGLGEISLHLLLFATAILMFQPLVFLILPFLTLTVLKDPEGRYTKRVISLFGFILGIVFAYTICFKLASLMYGVGRYSKARELLSADNTEHLLGDGYLRVFEFWNYPIAVSLEDQQKFILTLTAFVCILGVIFVVAVLDGASSRKRALQWGLVAVFFGTALLPILADGGGDRQHLAMTAAMIWPLVFYQSVVFVANRLSDRQVQAARTVLLPCAFLLVAFVAFGAAAGLGRAVIGHYSAFLRVVQYEFYAQNIADKTDVVVYLPSESFNETHCDAEPCTGYLARRVPTRFYTKREGFYIFAARTAGASQALSFSFVEAGTPLEDEKSVVVLDWRAMLASVGIPSPD